MPCLRDASLLNTCCYLLAHSTPLRTLSVPKLSNVESDKVEFVCIFHRHTAIDWILKPESIDTAGNHVTKTHTTHTHATQWHTCQWFLIPFSLANANGEEGRLIKMSTTDKVSRIFRRNVQQTNLHLSLKSRVITNFVWILFSLFHEKPIFLNCVAASSSQSR